jgi:hypothetical protein
VESRVDPILSLTNAGQKVSGSGPIDDWEPYEVGAIVTVIIVQPQQPNPGTMELAVASGSTSWIAAGAANWTATAKVRGALALQPGPAVAYAHGIIEYAPGVLKPYDWDVNVVLQ